MKLPVIQGLIERRMLVNYRVRPGALRAILPAPFRPKLVDGWGMAGICLIQLKHIRPRGVPEIFGISSENAAHRLAVEWDSETGLRDGVFIIRRDSSSRLNSLADVSFPACIITRNARSRRPIAQSSSPCTAMMA